MNIRHLHKLLLSSFALDSHADEFEEVRPPTLVLTGTMVSTGHLPKFEEEAYHLERDDLWRHDGQLGHGRRSPCGGGGGDRDRLLRNVRRRMAPCCPAPPHAHDFNLIDRQLRLSLYASAD